MEPGVRTPNASDMQVHDLLVQQEGADHQTSTCWICQQSTNDTTPPEGTDVDLQAQLDQATADRDAATAKVTEQDGVIADLRSQLDALTEKVAAQDADTRIADLERRLGEAEGRADTAEAAADAARTEFATFKAELQEIDDKRAEDARIADLASTRKAAVEDLGYTADFVTDERVARWARLPEDEWTGVFDSLTDAKPAGAPTREPASDGRTEITDADGNPVDPQKVADFGDQPPATDATGGGFRGLLRQRELIEQL